MIRFNMKGRMSYTDIEVYMVCSVELRHESVWLILEMKLQISSLRGLCWRRRRISGNHCWGICSMLINTSVIHPPQAWDNFQDVTFPYSVFVPQYVKMKTRVWMKQLRLQISLTLLTHWNTYHPPNHTSTQLRIAINVTLLLCTASLGLQ